MLSWKLGLATSWRCTSGVRKCHRSDLSESIDAQSVEPLVALPKDLEIAPRRLRSGNVSLTSSRFRIRTSLEYRQPDRHHAGRRREQSGYEFCAGRGEAAGAGNSYRLLSKMIIVECEAAKAELEVQGAWIQPCGLDQRRQSHHARIVHFRRPRAWEPIEQVLRPLFVNREQQLRPFEIGRRLQPAERQTSQVGLSFQRKTAQLRIVRTEGELWRIDRTRTAVSAPFAEVFRVVLQERVGLRPVEIRSRRPRR